MARLELISITKTLSHGQVLFENFDLQVAAGECVVLLGESGCGKTSLLRMIAGLDNAFLGEVRLDGQSIRGLPPQQRQCALMTQSGSLFPHMTVAENIGFPLKVTGVENAQIQLRLESIAENLGLSAYLHRLPHQLSGGQQQRVALARCLAQAPKLFLMDEPLSKLDSQAKQGLKEHIKKVHAALGITTLYVTHDQQEASQLADKIAVLGAHSPANTPSTRLLQFDSPETVYLQPATVQVAKALGTPSINVLKLQDFRMQPALNALAQQLPSNTQAIGIRPDAWQIVAHGEACSGAICDASNESIKGKVVRSEWFNGQWYVYWQVQEQVTQTSTAPPVLMIKSEVSLPSHTPIDVAFKMCLTAFSSTAYVIAFDAQGRNVNSLN